MNPVSAIASDQPALADLVEDLTARLKAGEAVDLPAYLAEHPVHAAELQRLYPALRLLADFSQSGSASVPPAVDGSEPMSAPGAAVGDLGDFRIIREVGRGGMGIVYEAEQISLGRRVALKVLPFAATMDPRHLQRFQNEARAAASLHHTNIVPVHAVGNERGVHYYAMQYIDGLPLSAVIQELRQQRQLHATDSQSSPAAPDQPTTAYAAPPGQGDVAGKPDAETARPLQGALSTKLSPTGREFFHTLAQLGEQAALALDHAHERGIVHRDIKPANLLLDGAGTLWITDFGLAQVQSDTKLTLTGDLLGTLRYMSPEQALAKRVIVDHRTDIYSLGATLYELLTLQPAFTGKDRQELLRQIAFEEPRPLRRVRKAIPAELETIILKALEKNPAERYGTARELARDLRRFLDNQPIQAQPPGIVQRLRKWGLRHQAAVAAAVAFLVLAVVLLSLSSIVIWRAWNQTDRALQTAVAREAETKAVLDFVENKIFAAARPKDQEGGQGYDVKLADAVKATLPFVDKSFTAQPLIEARLRKTMGVSFMYLGDARTASAQFQAARQLYTEHLGPDHPDTLRSMNNLANSYDAIGRSQEALNLREETLQLQKAKLGSDHPDTLGSMNNLANSYQVVGRTQDALNLNEETLQLRKAKLGSDHRDTLGSMGNLAACYEALGRLTDAIKLYEQALSVMKTKMPDHRFTFDCMAGLANSYAVIGRSQEALKLREETLQFRKAKLGADHPDTLASMNNLASSYGDAGRSQEALKLREETLQLQKARVGADHPDTLKSMHNLANSYAAIGRTQEALKLREETLQLRKAKLGADHPDTLASMNDLADSYQGVGRIQDGLNLEEETLQLMKAKLGSDHPSTLASMVNLANYYDALGRLTDAIKLYEQALPVMKTKMPDHDFTFNCMGNLAVSYQRAGRTQDALNLNEETLQLKKAKLGADHPHTLVSMNNLAISYRDAGRTQDALNLNEETLQLRKAKLGPDHPDTLKSMNNLAACYIHVGEAANAMAILQDTLTLRERRLKAQPGNSIEESHLAWTHGQMGQAEEGRHDYAAAAQAYGRSMAMFEKLDHSGALTEPFFRGCMNGYRQRVALCRKAERAVRDLDFALQQPRGEVAELLDLRVRFLLKEHKLPAAVESA
ncbi:MAG TPA: serine/threonine-protein kinase, partial [Gemmataceae bacterium]|nr:serine/threonine-protein kinase [Gemmataceae bacterium]